MSHTVSIEGSKLFFDMIHFFAMSDLVKYLSQNSFLFIVLYIVQYTKSHTKIVFIFHYIVW